MKKTKMTAEQKRLRKNELAKARRVHAKSMKAAAAVVVSEPVVVIEPEPVVAPVVVTETESARAKWQRTPCSVCGILHQSVTAYEKRVANAPHLATPEMVAWIAQHEANAN